MQQITVRHFLPALGITEKKLRAYKPAVGDPDISVEFQIAYRFGHDMIPNHIGKFDVVKLFDGEKFYRIANARGSSQPGRMNFELARLLTAVAGTPANEIDGKFSSALRNSLFGMFGEDLASRNLFRGRELGVPGYAALAKCFGNKPNTKARAALLLLPVPLQTGFALPCLPPCAEARFRKVPSAWVCEGPVNGAGGGCRWRRSRTTRSWACCGRTRTWAPRRSAPPWSAS